MESTLSGFCFYNDKGTWQLRIANKTIKRIKEKCKKITQRNNGSNTNQKITALKAVIEGWVNYFLIARGKSAMQRLDEYVRMRLRMGLWKEWKNCKTRVANLLKLKAGRQKSYEWGNSSRGYCRMAHSPVLSTTLNNGYFTRNGYEGFLNTYNRKRQQHRYPYFNKPPYAERHVRWCERTGSQIMATFLLDYDNFLFLRYFF